VRQRVVRDLRAADRGHDVQEHDDRKGLQIRHQRQLQRKKRYLLGKKISQFYLL